MGGEDFRMIKLNTINIKIDYNIYKDNMTKCKCCWHKQKSVMDFFKTECSIELTQSQLINMVQELYKKNIELEGRLLKLENKDRKKGKKNIIEYLKDKNSSCIFKKWIDTIEISKDDFELLSNYNYKECMIKILKRFLLKTTELPFCAFPEIKHNVYIYNKRLNDEEWYKMEIDDIKTIVYKIDDEYNKYYFKWADEHKSNESMNELVIFYFSKINCFEVLADLKLKQIQKCIYDIVNKPLKQTIEFEE